jgi:hypothetical protein
VAKRLAAQGDEVVFAHKPLNPLCIYNHAGTSEHDRDAPIAVEFVAQAEQLDLACQFDIRLARGTGLEAAIVARAGNACELAEVLNVDLAGVGYGYRSDDFRETRAIEPCRSAASKARKAF